MANKKISDLSALTSVASGDLLEIVDISDTTDSAEGSSKKITQTNLTAPERVRLDNLETVVNNASASAPASIDLAEDTDNGTNKITITAPSAVASDKVLTFPDATDTLVGKATTDTFTNKILSTGVSLDANADQNITQYGMARQAIMNGNFDVWQRGTSHTTFTDSAVTFLADRYADVADDDGGTKPTLTRSRQLQTSGDMANSFYFSRLATNGAGTSLGNNSYHFLKQDIENGTRNLCGLNKTVTVSFWARSSIANKKLGFYTVQSYGTGGSPTAAEVISGGIKTLTSTWTKYTHTFTTNTLVGKTFGTAVDDYLSLRFVYEWGTTQAPRVGETLAETYVGAGNIDIAQVQLCSGDVALPFQPKSYGEELRACQRYYNAGIFRNFSTLAYIGGTVKFSNAMRTMNVTYTDLVGNASKISSNVANNLSVTGGAVVSTTVGLKEGFCIDAAISGTAGSWVGIAWVNNAEL